MKNIGFIGVGYMGYGIAKNVLKNNHKLYVVANKNREPIDKLVNEGAKEVLSYKEFFEHNINCLMMCVTNTPIAIKIAEELSSLIKDELLIIDLTTHDKTPWKKNKNWENLIIPKNKEFLRFFNFEPKEQYLDCFLNEKQIINIRKNHNGKSIA